MDKKNSLPQHPWFRTHDFAHFAHCRTRDFAPDPISPQTSLSKTAIGGVTSPVHPLPYALSMSIANRAVAVDHDLWAGSIEESLRLGRETANQAGALRGHRTEAWKRERRSCEGCGHHQTLFRYRGDVKADRMHRLCFQCYRALKDSVRRVVAPQSCNWPAAVATNPAPPARAAVRATDGDRQALYDSLHLRRRCAQLAARHALARAVDGDAA